MEEAVGFPGSRALLERLHTQRSLPTLPRLLLELIRLSSRPESDPEELARIVQRDPALSERVMRLASSAAGGRGQRVPGVPEALKLLGAEAVRNLAVSSSVEQAFQGPPARHGLDLQRFWWHSVRCAVNARLLAVRTAYPSPEEAFRAGLLHDIGKPLLWSSFRREYSTILKSSGDTGAGLLAAERRLGLTHPEAGAWLLGRWDAGSFLPDAVRYHHESPERVAAAFPLVRIVFAANQLCPEAGAAGLAAAGQSAGLGSRDLETLRAEASEEARRIASSLGIDPEAPPDRAEEEALSRLARDQSQLAGVGAAFLKATRTEEVLAALRRGLALLFDLTGARWFRLENGVLQSEAEAGGEQLSVPCRESSGLLARCLARGEALDSFSPLSAPSIVDEQLARHLGGEGLLCVPLRAEGHGLGALVVGIRARDHAALASRETLLGLLADQAASALYALAARERREAADREQQIGSASAQARRVVHEARNPLGIISNYLAILSAKLQDNVRVQEDLRIVREEIRRVSQIISELGGRPESGPPVREPVDLNALLADLVRLTREPLWENSRIRVQLSADPRVPPLPSDQNRLKQVFLNLVKNAAEAMPGGGDLLVQTRMAGGRVEVSVHDEGAGIPEEVRDRLFEPFVSTKAQEGLGLAVVHGVVRELGGTIRFETGGGGTTFRVQLPLA